VFSLQLKSFETHFEALMPLAAYHLMLDNFEAFIQLNSYLNYS
jgi:hypothetical protein